MEKRNHGCPECPAFGKYCPRPPRKGDYKFPKEENKYLIDKECGVYSCQETVDRLMEKIRWRKFSEEKPVPDVYYICKEGKQSVDAWTGESWIGHSSVDYWMPIMETPMVGMALDVGD